MEKSITEPVLGGRVQKIVLLYFRKRLKDKETINTLII
jgi:hypothetical protein